MEKQVLILIPAYNEEGNIRRLLRQLKEDACMEYAHVLVIDDGSKDQTRQVVLEEGMEVISQVYNMGYGAALQTGYKYAVLHQYRYVIQIDADGQHDVKNVDAIYRAMTSQTTPDIVIGSRYLEGSVSFKMSGIRLMAVKMFRRIIRKVTKVSITDPTSGLQGLDYKAFSYYSQYSNFDIKYPDINMIIQMLLLGYKVEEVPAIMHERTEGTPMHSGILKPMKYMILMMISTMNAILRYYRVRE